MSDRPNRPVRQSQTDPHVFQQNGIHPGDAANTGFTLATELKRGTGLYAVWRGMELDAVDRKDGWIMLLHFGFEAPTEDFKFDPDIKFRRPFQAFTLRSRDRSWTRCLLLRRSQRGEAAGFMCCMSMGRMQ